MNERPRIDLYSDTQTRPSRAMREAMANAEVGDEQRNEDPTVRELCTMVAELLGKDAALFLPSGTMCNEIAYRTHTRPGDEIILHETSHALALRRRRPGRPLRESCCVRCLEQEGCSLPARYAPRSAAMAPTFSVRAWSRWRTPPISAAEQCGASATSVRSRTPPTSTGLSTHMDGARLMNAVVASGVPAAEFARGYDSAWIDMSKGLGAPVGGVLAGSHEFIARALRHKHQFGGAMRQAGIIAAAGVYALKHNVDRLADDHDNAKRFARAHQSDRRHHGRS